QSASANNGRRFFSNEDRAVHLSVSAPARPELGIENVLRNMKAPFSEAVILMAGCGSRLRQGYGGHARLRGNDETFLKPLVPVLGRPVVSYVFDALAEAGLKKIIAIIGFEARRLGAALKELVPAGIELLVVENREWQKQNGVSALAARGQATAPFLLTMSDHVFDPAIVD